jgi:hypothetical protein
MAHPVPYPPSKPVPKGPGTSGQPPHPVKKG